MHMRHLEGLGGGSCPTVAGHSGTVAGALGKNCMPPLEVGQEYTNLGDRILYSISNVTLVVLNKQTNKKCFARVVLPEFEGTPK